MITTNYKPYRDRRTAIGSLQFDDFMEFCKALPKSFAIKILIQGNLVKSTALEIAKLILCNMKILESSRELSPRQPCEISLEPLLEQPYPITVGSSYLKLKSMRQNDSNSVLKNYYQIGKTTIHEECLTDAIVSLMSEPLFDALRNKEQLGYGVACSARKNCGLMGILITVEYQESKNSSDAVDQSIERFLRNFYAALKLMNDLGFSSVRRSLVSIKLLPDVDLEKEVNRNWSEIRNGDNVFNRNELQAVEMEKVAKDEIVEFYYRVFLSRNDVRKLSVQIVGDKSFAK